MKNTFLVSDRSLDTVLTEMSRVPVDVDMLIEQFKKTNRYNYHTYDTFNLPKCLFDLHLSHLLTILKDAVPTVDLDPILKGQLEWEDSLYRFFRTERHSMRIYARNKLQKRGGWDYTYDAVIGFPLYENRLLPVVWKSKMISSSNEFGKSLRRMTSYELGVLNHTFYTSTFACVLLLPSDFLHTSTFFIDHFIEQGGKVITAPISYKDYMNLVQEKSIEHTLF